MKRRILFPIIAALAGAFLAGGGIDFDVPAVAQQQEPPPAEVSGGALDERIVRLEERIRDLQSVIGTLQSFIRDGAAGPVRGPLPPAGALGERATAGAPGDISIRVLALETQIRALTGQMEQITKRLTGTQSPPGAGALPFAPGRQPVQQGQQPGTQSGASFSSLQRKEAEGAAPAQAPLFGTTTSGPRSASPLAPAAPRPHALPYPPLAALPGGGEGPRATYDASYQNFLRNDFVGAENGFRGFITNYRDDPLIGNAYYWLGRTHFVRGQFKPAADAFLAGYKKDKESAIAPDALLHLGLSLVQLGEKEAACATLDVVSKKYPDASDKVKQDAAAAIERARC